MVSWMSEMSGPGAYGRKSKNREAKAAYNSLVCAPALIWMAEALGENPDVVRCAVAAADSAGANFTSQCVARHRVIAWNQIEELISEQSSGAGRLRKMLKNGRG